MIDKSGFTHLSAGKNCPACRENNVAKFLSRSELATRWNIESKTLANWSSAKIGPPVTKIAGRLVRYALADIETFERSTDWHVAAPTNQDQVPDCHAEVN